MDYGFWFDYILEMERFMESYLDYFIYVIYYEDMKEVILFIYENIYLILENEFML